MEILCERDILKTVSIYTQLVTLYVYLCTYLLGCKINTFFCRGSMALCTEKIGVDQLHLEVHIFLWAFYEYVTSHFLIIMGIIMLDSLI